ncbi:MAG: BT4734/BF3469 family protein [Prevotella sp.]|nr:BT4734/BF3469 family protein [Prevotella sp.]
MNNVSSFENFTSKRPVSLTLDAIANFMRCDQRLESLTKAYRQTGSKHIKMETPLFAVACFFDGGKGKENIKGLTGLSMVDFDHISPSGPLKEEELSALRSKIAGDPHTVMCYTTISGNGLRIIFRYEQPQSKTDGVGDHVFEQYKAAFYAGNAYYEKLLGMKADMQCKNITRLSGIAHDPDVFFRDPDKAEAFTLDEVAAAASQHAKESKEEKQMQRIQTYYDSLVAPMLARKGYKFQPSCHNDYVMRVGYMLAERRFSKKVVVRWALRMFGADYSGTEQVINSCFASSSSRGRDGGRAGKGDANTASVDEIKAFLDGRVRLRYNVITSRVECLLTGENTNNTLSGLNTNLTNDTNNSLEENTNNSLSGLNTNLNDTNNSLGENTNLICPQWQPISDRIVNTLWSQMSSVMRVNIQDIYRVIESDYVPAFNPFVEYLESLPEWHEGDHDYIADLAATVKIKGEQEHMESPEADSSLFTLPSSLPSQEADSSLFTLRSSLPSQEADSSLFTLRSSLKKWLVGMVAGWISEDVVNNVILVFIGEQGAYKTTWFNYLLPPQLKQYFYTKTNANRMTRDDLLTLAQYGLVCCEELDTMRPAELNQLKAAVTMPSIDERAAYAHFHEHRKHIASFCGTGNNVSFLSDPTGNRRWLPFEVESIVSPREHPFCYEGIYSQALALYKSGFTFWFTKEEIQEQNRHNRKFETPRLEHELVDLYFRKPLEHENSMFMTSSRVLQIIGSGITQKLSATRIGMAFSELGFQRVRYHGIRGYLVMQRTAEEIMAYQKSMAMHAMPNYDLPF